MEKPGIILSGCLDRRAPIPDPVWRFAFMPRWIVFDQDTASKLRSHLPQASVFEAPGRAALEYALNNPRSVVTVLPPAVGNGAMVAVFRPERTLSRPARTSYGGPGGSGTAAAPVKSSRVRASGFLGLNDAPVLEEDEEQEEKRRWWEFWRE
jgi:hypothetical protein